jgi:hypothetical protein
MYTTGFPIPLANNGFGVLKAMSKINQIKCTVLEEYWLKSCGMKHYPPILLDFATPNGMLVISDPTLVNELYL